MSRMIVMIFTGLMIGNTLMFSGVVSAQNAEQVNLQKMLTYYQEYGMYTDPGEYEGLFSKLPESLTDLCSLIKAQLIHPVADLAPYRHLIPKERHNEDAKYPGVKALLSGLLEHNPAGLIPDRRPEDRLVVSCRYHAILLASILKSRGIPTRVRYGFAPYLSRNNRRHIYHVICEVWNADGHRWMLVDPDRQMVDFPRDRFEFVADVWLRYQHGELDPSKYGVADWWGAHPILDVFCHDIAAVLRTEHLYWEHPPISKDAGMDVQGLPKDQVDVLNTIAKLLQSPEIPVQELQTLYNTHQFLQFQQ